MAVLISSVRHSSHFYNECRKRLVGCMMSPPVYRTRTEMYRLQHSLVAESLKMTASFRLDAYLAILVEVNLRKLPLDIFALFVTHYDTCIVWKNEESFVESSRCRSCTETLELDHRDQARNSCCFRKRGKCLTTEIYIVFGVKK